jgi:hypothetical protein
MLMNLNYLFGQLQFEEVFSRLGMAMFKLKSNKCISSICNLSGHKVSED